MAGSREDGVEMIVATPDEERLLGNLRRGDEEAFAALVDCHSSSMLRVATMYVRSRAVAEEVVQDTWIRVLRGVGRFEGRSSLKTWIFRILTNSAKTRAEQEGRSVPFSELAWPEADHPPSVDLSRFRDATHGERADWWVAPLNRWPNQDPSDRLFARETRTRIRRAIAGLPPKQRIVLTLRDIEGWSAEEVCDALELSDQNQRLLLHRARSRLRSSLERYLNEDIS